MAQDFELPFWRFLEKRHGQSVLLFLGFNPSDYRYTIWHDEQTPLILK